MDVKIPNLGEGVDSGLVAAVFVKVGELVEKDAPILELESEKAVAAFPSPAAGVVTKIHVKQGETVRVGQTVITLESAAGETVKPKQAPQQPAKAAPKAGTAEIPQARPQESAEEVPSALPSGVPPSASPSVRRMARELGIDLTKVRGSERGGRIVVEDIKAYIQRLQKVASAPKAQPEAEEKTAAQKLDFSKWGKVSRKPMSAARRTIAQRMHESWSAVPRVTQFDEADITSLMQLRKKHLAAYQKKGSRLTLTSFAVKGVAEVLKKHPIINSSIDDESGEIVLKHYHHIGVAVDTEHGLMVPIIRDADRKSLLEISKDIEALADKARERKLSIDEMKGGSFTISNQGGIGGGHFTPIVNHPQVAILGMGRGALKAVIVGKNIEQRLILPLSLSYDHRAIDGADAARFMVDLVAAFEQFKEKDIKI